MTIKQHRLLLGIISLVFLFSFVSIGVCPYVNPTLSNPYPTDNMIDVDVLQSTVNITIYHPYYSFNWTIEGIYIVNTGADYESNGSKIANLITPLPYNTKIMWYVNVTNTKSWEIPSFNATYNFTTIKSGKLRDNPVFNDIEKALIGLMGVIILVAIAMLVYRESQKKNGDLVKPLVAMLLVIIFIGIIFSVL